MEDFMNRKEFSKHLILYVSIAVLLVTTAFSVSRAYYLANISGNEDAKPTNISTANVDIDFLTSQYINNSNMMLIEDSKHTTTPDYTTFAISSTSNSTLTVDYTLAITEFSISSNFVSSDFKWELVKVDGSTETLVESGNFSNAVSGTDYVLTTTNLSIAPQDTQKYTFRIWLSYADRDQNSLLQGSFSGKIALTTGKITKE